jgi:hypothetical protein
MPKKSKQPKEPVYRCPNCGSDNLLVYEQTSWVMNTGEFYCHSVKAHDSNAKVCCQDTSCMWVGERSEVMVSET